MNCPLAGSGIRTCLAKAMQNLGVRKALPCSAKGFFESFYDRIKEKTANARFAVFSLAAV